MKKMVIFSLVLVFILFNIGEKEVKANNCEVHTNYYVLLAAHTRSVLLNGMENGTYIKEHTKSYNLGIPTEIINEGVTEISATSTDDGPDSMSLRTFYEIYSTLSDQEAYDADGVEHYIWSDTWNNVGTGETGDNRNMPSSFSAFKSVVLYADDVDADINIVEADENGVSVSIERTYNQDDVEAIDIGDDDMIYSPSIYYFQYEVCDDYDVTVHYMDEANEKELFNTVIKEDLADGDKYDAYTCPSTLKDYNSYSLNKNKKYQHDSGTIDGKNVDLYCYYDKKATLTINFGTNNDCSEGNDIKDSVTSEQIVGQDVKYTILTEFSDSNNKYEFSNVGLVSPTFSTKISSSVLNFKMPDKNTSICLVYVKNPQTGIGWIYFVWIIGIVALLYSGLYFMKYYKNQNNEI